MGRTQHHNRQAGSARVARLCLLLLAASMLAGCSLLGKVGLDPAPRPAPRMGSANPVVQTVEGVVGVPYKWGGESPREGFDCSGLVYWAYAQHGVRIPRVSWQQVEHGRRIGRHDLRAGDLVFFDTGQRRGFHVGLVTGRGTFLHSPKAGSRVSESSLDNSYWYRKFMFGRRVVQWRSVATR